MSYPIIQLPDDAPTQLEQLGTKTKFWFRDQNGQSMLFKEGRPGTGENWAEKVCCEICGLIDMPHADYDLAIWKESKGVVTPSFVPVGARLVFGNELLAKIFNDYEEGKRYRVRQHTVRTVMAVASFKDVGLPLGWSAPAEIKDAADLFAGYLMLDALVSNQDRHHENWGLVFVPDKGVFFAPTFDHASSLGRNETDTVRTEMLATRDRGRSVEAYVERAISALYATPPGPKPLGTLEAFAEAAKIRPDAAAYWMGRLANINLEEFRGILEEVPDTDISAPARDFACRMLEINRQRILKHSGG
ncbi:MAG TPA: hypothetical protein VIH29_07815 [Gallionella sp.]